MSRLKKPDLTRPSWCLTNYLRASKHQRHDCGDIDAQRGETNTPPSRVAWAAIVPVIVIVMSSHLRTAPTDPPQPSSTPGTRLEMAFDA